MLRWWPSFSSVPVFAVEYANLQGAAHITVRLWRFALRLEFPGRVKRG